MTTCMRCMITVKGHNKIKVKIIQIEINTESVKLPHLNTEKPPKFGILSTALLVSKLSEAGWRWRMFWSRMKCHSHTDHWSEPWDKPTHGCGYLKGRWELVIDFPSTYQVWFILRSAADSVLLITFSHTLWLVVRKFSQAHWWWSLSFSGCRTTFVTWRLVQVWRGDGGGGRGRGAFISLLAVCQCQTYNTRTHLEMSHSLSTWSHYFRSQDGVPSSVDSK